MSTKPNPEGGVGTPSRSKKAAAKAVGLGDDAREHLDMKRWLRVTARRSLSGKKALGQSGNPAADAAAAALAELLKEAKELA
jgi:hypothetical protein